MKFMLLNGGWKQNWIDLFFLFPYKLYLQQFRWDKERFSIDKAFVGCLFIGNGFDYARRNREKMPTIPILTIPNT